MTTCPNCGKINNCNCKNCNPNGDSNNLVILDYENNGYQCCFCHHKFNEQDSMDYDWEIMVDSFAEKIKPELCLEWISLNGYERYDLEKKYSQIAFQLAFTKHFKIHWKSVTPDIYLQLKRNLTIDNICLE
jgi:hypothetical protein